jgi:thiamine pyrophosphokinase
MSSHHIVRDDQEPALIVANGASCNPNYWVNIRMVSIGRLAIERVMKLDGKS